MWARGPLREEAGGEAVPCHPRCASPVPFLPERRLRRHMQTRSLERGPWPPLRPATQEKVVWERAGHWPGCTTRPGAPLQTSCPHQPREQTPRASGKGQRGGPSGQGQVCAESRMQERRSSGVPWAIVARCGTCGVLGTLTPGEAGGAPGPGDFKVWGSLSPSCAYGKGVACISLSLYSVPTWSHVRSGSRGHFCWDQAGKAGGLRVPQDVLREEKGQ